ncbi:MAG: EAL domain-containing protein [Deltaproteobacteria bacterium]|nr:EAL domain-containing protein [Deltaproteobacteria bacterium]
MIAKKDIKKALEKNELDYFYQPKVSAITGDIVGAEALIRWIKTDGKVIPPGAFIPLAEESGLIKEITLQLFKKLERSIKLIHEIKPLCVSFNVTADDLETDKLSQEIIDALKEKRLTPSSLELEITESKLIKSKPSVKDNLNRIVDIGVGVAMDDFGTGYSSLNVLSNYPFSTLKLDYNLINGITSDNKKKFITKTAIRMAHLLKIDIVAEGVDNKQQYDLLQYMGCTIIQGYLISKPLPLDEFIDFLKKDIRYPGSAAGKLHMISIDHILWYRDFVYYVMSRLQKISYTSFPPPIPSPHRCMFGEWFYKEGKIFLTEGLSDQSVKELEKLHLSIHDEAQKIIEIFKQRVETTKYYANILINFNRFHQDFINKLQECENSLVYSYLTPLIEKT